jgi:hypothetical protein
MADVAYQRLPDRFVRTAPKTTGPSHQSLDQQPIPLTRINSLNSVSTCLIIVETTGTCDG